MEQIEQLFNQFDQLVEESIKQTNDAYLEGLLDILNLVVMDKEEVNSEKEQLLQERLPLTSFDALDNESKRKIVELLTLKAMKGATQQQHLITPDSVSSYVSYLAEKLLYDKKTIRLFDPVSGSANLLTSVINQLKNHTVQGYGSEIDPTFTELGLLNATIQKHDIEFFHQDSIQPLLLDPVDLVIADLPIGFYPDDERAKAFKVHSEHEHTYAHHLLIEQSLMYTTPGGYAMFVIPNTLFNSDQSTYLHQLIQESAHVIALLQLPTSLFRSNEEAKSLFVLQKKGDHTKAPKEALMAQLPSFKNMKATENMVLKMNAWFKEEGYKSV
ncbi:site-specific DNA-methyltransferase (adenine-specific) [Pelagirhabdus alkalitolerans]|uniref:Site-specific DNA-methyltransferase (Adenine-specific) n=1 Tax=Pelagirhabdus alkalitolerans TaxID=1612202 RepID=A0A1G6HJC9_9BACI|nr:class I SAM-dependent methyltransferase [Pelagirhabdus alkalitolerans]SDB94360.1 site-specific DNA-methyltransferase (adenine-specific) [Pelagirhabdus alkalitolerans]